MTIACDSVRVLRVGIVGCGRVADYHAQFIHADPRAELVAIADVDEARAREFAQRYRVAAVFGSLDRMLAEVRLDVLHVVTPPHLHVRQALAAVDRGVHVLVEKPVSFEHVEAESLFQLASRRGVLVCPDFIHLFHPRVLEARELIEGGRLGRVVHCEVFMGIDLDIELNEVRESINPHWSFQLPGGVLQNYISHALYLALYWMGGFQQLYTTPKVLGSQPQGMTDHVDIVIAGERAMAHVTLSFVTRPSPFVVRIYCERGVVQLDIDRLTLVVEKPSTLPRTVSRLLGTVSQSWQLMACAVGNVVNRLRGSLVPYQGLRTLISDFYQSVLEGGTSPVPAQLALAVSRAEEAVLAQSGKLRVDVNPRPCRQEEIRRPQRILVTGASGYLGREVVRALVRHGYSVRALVRLMSRIDELEALGVEIYFGDLRSRETVLAAATKVDVIVHLGAALRGSSDFMDATAICGTASIAESAQRCGVHHVIYMSSLTIYDYLSLRDGDVIDPESPLEPLPQERGRYSAAKCEAEKIALEHLYRGTPPWTILRPSVFFGNGCDPTRLVGLRRGRWLFCTGGPRRRLLLIHVRDVAHAIVLAIESPQSRGKIYTLSHPDTVRLSDYARTCGGEGRQGGPRIVYVPYTVAYGAMLLAKGLGRLVGRRIGINRRRLASLYRDVGVDGSLIGQDLGWAPSNGLFDELQAEARQLEQKRHL